MIVGITAWRYRCLKTVQVRLGRFNILAGPNGSGKSTLLDVLRFLSDLLSGDLERAVQIETDMRSARGKGPTSELFKALAKRVSLERCGDAAFCKLRDTLRRWFPIRDATHG